MNNSYLRHLSYLLAPVKVPALTTAVAGFAGAVATDENLPAIPDEFNAKDWLTFLLHVDAELEHSLMVQYLYAAYSLGGDHIADERRELIRGWQEIILGIAKEEMGHFVTIQNVLRVIGAPLNFDRQDFPWDSKLYPFDFTLEPLSRASLAKYIYAESPVDWIKANKDDDEEMRQIKKEIGDLLPKEMLGDPISRLFRSILHLLGNTDLIPDDVFLSETYPYQAKFDEWGRGYAGGARGNSTDANPTGAPDVLVKPFLARTDTIRAVNQIAEQGESPKENDDKLSHFNRFLGIYKIWRKLPAGFNPSRNLAVNPVVPTSATAGNENADADADADRQEGGGRQQDLITNPVARQWAGLFNVRYRMLLTYLTHSFLIGGGFSDSVNSPRGAIIHATFGEMYNLRSIANILIRLPLGAENSDKKAGPPFTIPYTMSLPIGEMNRWRMHTDLIAAAATLIDGLLKTEDQPHKSYLYALKEADEQLKAMASKITVTA